MDKICYWYDVDKEICTNTDCPQCHQFCPMDGCLGICRFEKEKILTAFWRKTPRDNTKWKYMCSACGQGSDELLAYCPMCSRKMVDPDGVQKTAFWVWKETCIRSLTAKNLFCVECGFDSGQDYKFCPGCGARMIRPIRPNDWASGGK